MTVIPNAVYKSQRNNVNNPYGSCNVTSMVMGLCWGGCPETIQGQQIEDVLYNFLEDNGYSRHYPYDLSKATNKFREQYFPDISVFSTLNVNATWEQVENNISQGKPCVIHGWFTFSGHIIEIVGKDGDDWIVNDPYGEWTSSGYIDIPGKELRYSHNLMNNVCGPNGTMWVHFFDYDHPKPFPKIENRFRANETDLRLQTIYEQKLEIYENDINNHAYLVKQIQIRLRDCGFDPGKIDSVWGNITRSAYLKFCGKHKIYPEVPINSYICKIIIESK